MEKRMLTSAEIFEETVYVGVKKGKSHPLQTAVLGLLAGAFIALGAYGAATASHSIENVGIQKLVAGLVFPVGLMLVLICGAELFTGNTLLVVAFAEKKISFKQLIKNWTIVYFTNMLGALTVAFLIFNTGLLDTNSGLLGGYALKVASFKGGLSFTKALASGILCNFLVCLSVWGTYAAKDIAGKVLMAFFPVMVFVITGFEHSVANMYYFSIALFAKLNPAYAEAGHITAEKLAKIDAFHIINNLIPVTIGNIIGGGVFVGLAYWVVYRYAANLKTDASNTLSN